MKVYEVPLSPEAQTLSIKLGAATYHLTLVWNELVEIWMLDIADENEIVLLTGIPVVAGTDLLGQHQHLGFAGSLYAGNGSDMVNPPTFTNLGKEGKLFFGVP